MLRLRAPRSGLCGDHGFRSRRPGLVRGPYVLRLSRYLRRKRGIQRACGRGRLGLRRNLHFALRCRRWILRAVTSGDRSFRRIGCARPVRPADRRSAPGMIVTPAAHSALARALGPGIAISQDRATRTIGSFRAVGPVGTLRPP